MKAFDPNYKLLDEMYQDDYYPAFLVNKVKDELQKVIDLLESGETDTDAVQETLRKCWQKRGQLRDERYLQTWVVRVLLNECHSIQRRSARVQPAEQLPERAVSPQPMGQGRLHDALLALPEKLRMPLVLYYMEGYSVEETASMLRVPQGTVKTRLRKGRQELKKLLLVPENTIGGLSHETYEG